MSPLSPYSKHLTVILPPQPRLLPLPDLVRQSGTASRLGEAQRPTVIPSAARNLSASSIDCVQDRPATPLNFYSRLRALLRTLCLCVVIFFLLLPSSLAQSLDKPTTTIDEDITSFAFAPDGRIVYSVRRMFRNKKYDMQRDDIWIADGNGGRRQPNFNRENFTAPRPLNPGNRQ